MLDRFDLAFLADGFPNQGLDPVKAVEDDRVEVVFLSLESAIWVRSSAIESVCGNRATSSCSVPFLAPIKTGLGACEQWVDLPTPSTP